MEVGGAFSDEGGDQFIVNIFNSLILTSMIAKRNYSHLKTVRIVGKQIVNERLARILHRIGFSPVIKGEGYGTMDFSEYFKKVANQEEDI